MAAAIDVCTRGITGSSLRAVREHEAARLMTTPLLKLFAKQPVPGLAKTRLAASIGAQAAARVATGLIVETVRLATSAWPGEVRLCVWPDADHALFRTLRQRHRIGIDVQVAGDLGDKMRAALHDGLEQGRSTVVMGCDAPHCLPDTLNDVAARLAAGANVIAPAQDGGFWLVGLSTAAPDLFKGVDWSQEGTLAPTLEGAERTGVMFDSALPVLFDIDVEADLKKLALEFPELAERITRAPTDAHSVGNKTT